MAWAGATAGFGVSAATAGEFDIELSFKTHLKKSSGVDSRWPPIRQLQRHRCLIRANYCDLPIINRWLSAPERRTVNSC